MSMHNPVGHQPGQHLFSRDPANPVHPRALHPALARNELLDLSVPNQPQGSLHELQIRASELQEGTPVHFSLSA